MKVDSLKKIIKDAVREAIQEELKDIILEAVRSPKAVVNESRVVTTPSVVPSAEKRTRYMDIVGEMASGFNPSTGTFSATSENVFRPTTVNTAAEGSALPQGDVSMDQIMGLLKT